VTEYNVTVELEGVDPDGLLDRLDTDGRYSPAVHAAPGGRTALTLTVEQPDVAGAAGLGLGLVVYQGFEPYAVAALPTDEFDRRAGLAVDVPVMVSVPEAAEALNVSQQRVRQLLEGGKLTGTKVGRDWLVSRASVDQRVQTLPR
jgi:excisionase family DNA binding protein